MAPLLSVVEMSENVQNETYSDEYEELTVYRVVKFLLAKVKEVISGQFSKKRIFRFFDQKRRLLIFLSIYELFFRKKMKNIFHN